MEFDAVQRKIGEVILTGEHIVPRYQRPYAWEAENVQDIWEDLKSAPVDGHFIGNMVVYPSGVDQWDIVDGQQRLTTILIALRAVKDAYESIGETGRSEGLKLYLQHPNLSGEVSFRLRYKSENGFLHLNIFTDSSDQIRERFPSSEAERAQFEAYRMFRNLIDSEIGNNSRPKVGALDAIRDRFLRASVVYVRVDDKKTAFTIFETLNDRGKSLSAVDLVKNIVISSIPEGGAREEESLWAASIESIENSKWTKVKSEDFLGYFWNSTSHQSDEEIVVLNRVRRSVDTFLRHGGSTEDQARNFVREFSQTADIFKHFQKCLDGPNGKHWESVVPPDRWRNDRYATIDSALYGCLVPGSNLPLNLLFALLRNYIYSPKKILKNHKLVEYLNVVEALQFRWSIAKKPSTSTIRRAFRKAAFGVDSANTVSDLDATLSILRQDATDIMPTDVQFRDGLKRLTYFTQRPQDVHRVRHVLERVETKWGNSKLPRGESMTIEHIEAQGSRSINSPQNFWVGKLGNLMLLPMSVNSVLPNDFEQKSTELANWTNENDIILTDQLRKKEWGNSEANIRRERILDVATTVWPKDLTR